MLYALDEAVGESELLLEGMVHRWKICSCRKSCGVIKRRLMEVSSRSEANFSVPGRSDC